MTSEHPEYDFLDPPKREGEIGRMGPYRIHGLLGKGGMGEVFRARDSRLQRTVAIKLMRKKLASTPSSRKRFVEEARSMAAIHHDNVATIFEVGIHRSMPFIAMEMLRGRPLDKLLRAKSRFPYEQVLRLAKEVSRGLAAAHECGIIHRDIKPANIWIEEPSGRAKILDFGLAIANANLDQFSSGNSVVGSPAYLSPEQARNDPVDNRTDFYGLGVMMYQMCAGELPVISRTIHGQLISVICQNPTPLLERNPDVPRPLCELIHLLLSKEPRDRPFSAVRLEQLVDEVADRCLAESHGALQIVTESPSEKPKEQKTTKLTDGVPFKSTSILPWTISAAVLIVIAGFAWWSAKPKRLASEPVPLTSKATQPKQKPVTVESLKPLELRRLIADKDTVIRGHAALYKMSIRNNAIDAANDPVRMNANAKVVAQIVTLLKQPGKSQIEPRVFAKRFSAKQLPRAGESKEVEIPIFTNKLPLEDFDVVFELQSPSKQVISTISTQLRIEENLRDSDLLGFERLRTHVGRGADAYVRSGSKEDWGGKPVLETHRKGGARGSEQEHIYLRFDLSKCSIPKHEVDRAVLLLTVAQGGHQATSSIDAYGILEGLDPQWVARKDGHLTWEAAPCRDGIGGQKYLGQFTINNFKDNLKDVPDGVRFSSHELDEFIRSAPNDLVTIVLIRENPADKPTLFKSRDGKPKEAPALALRRRPQDISRD